MQSNINWARWKPRDPGELLGSTIREMYSAIIDEATDPDGERCFLIYGKSGRGKSTVADFVGNDYADHETNIVSYKGGLVTKSVVEYWIERGHTRPLWGNTRAIIINEVNNVNKDVQDILHDWLQDELPDNYIVIATTNKKPCRDEDWEKMSERDQKEHLTPRFSSRFTKYEAPDLSIDELTNEIHKRCNIPEKAARVCAANGAGNIRNTFKDVQKAIRYATNKKRKEQYVTNN
jgi:replication-associated recombination protein RarA